MYYWRNLRQLKQPAELHVENKREFSRKADTGI